MNQSKPENKQLLSEYRSRINRVMDHVERNLSGEFSLDQLSRIAGFSKYHFNRIFHSLTGEPLFSFIQRIRVEKAAGLLLTNRYRSITDIAYDCGFSSSAAFSRSFRNRFGISATNWRKKNPDPSDIESGYTDDSSGLYENQITPLHVEIKDLKPKTVAYIRYTGPYKGDDTLFRNLYKSLFTWAIPRNLVDPSCAESLVLYHDSLVITDQDKLRLSVCIEIPDSVKISGEIGKMSVSGGKYVCARFRLDTKEYPGAWNWVFSRFFPESGYQPDDRPAFEFYPLQEQTSSQKTKIIVDICIPVKPL